MKHIALAATAALSLVAIAAPAQAAQFLWDVEYTGFFEADGGGSITGSFVADDSDAQDGIVSDDEFDSWTWNWSGNDVVDAFSISSSDGSVDPFFGSSFYVDGTPNTPESGLDQGVYTADSGNEVLDLEFLIVEDLSAGTATFGDPFAAGAAITVSDPKPVPEPATILGMLVVLAGAGTSAVKRQKQAQEA